MEKNIFSLKREADNILSRVGAGSSPFEDMEKWARRLAEIGDRAIPFVANYLGRAKDPESVERLMHLIELLNDCAYTPMLKEALLNRKFRGESLRTRVEILATLKSYDLDYFDDFHNIVFDDDDDVFMLWVGRVLEDFHSREYRVISLLEEILLKEANPSIVVDKIAASFSADAVPLLAILADCDNDEASAASLNCLGKIKDESSAKALNYIIRFSCRKQVREEAEKSLRKLSFSGVHVQRTDEIAPPPRRDNYNVFVSPVDSVGNVNLCISLKKTKARSETMFVVINDEAGIIDIFGSKDMENSDLDSMIDEVKKDSFLAERDLSYALKLVNDALFKSEKNGLPLPPEFHYRKALLNGMMKPERYRPRFKLSTVRKAYRNKELIKRCDELFENNEFREWLISVPRVFDYAEKLRSIRKKRTSPLARLKEGELISSFCMEVIFPLKGLFVERLFKIADFLYQSKHSEESALMALATALRLGSKNSVDLTAIPFVKAMAEKSIEHCAEAIENGFDLRDLCDGPDDLED